MSRPIGILAGACLFSLAFPNFNFSLLAWIALVPLLFVIEGASPKQAFLRAWAGGTFAYVIILYWLIPTFAAAHLSFFLAPACLLALSAYLGLYWGAWGWFLIISSSPAAFSRASFPADSGGESTAADPPPVIAGDDAIIMKPLAAAAFWVILEYIRTFLFSGFPWTLLGDSQVHYLPLIQLAAFTGVYGVSFLIVWGNVALAAALKGSRQSLIPFFVALACTIGYGYHALSQIPKADGNPLKIALLQGNIDQYKKWDEVYVAEIKASYETLALRAAAQGAQLIVWPETSAPGYIMQEPALRLWLTHLVLKTQAWNIVGSPAESGKKAYNSAFAVSPIGWATARYSKIHLVPFGETVPFQSLLGVWIPVLNALGGFDAGADSPVMITAGVPVGINICYEAIFPDLVRRSVKSGGEVIVNITNDGWYMKTAAPYQHLAPNVFRAVENHRWLARADNTGVSAIIAPTGAIAAQTPIYQARVLAGTVYARTDRTFYTRFGNVFAWLCLFFCIGWIYFRPES